MISIIKLAFRNCLRHKKRSLLTFLSITIGIIVLLISTTVVNGIDETTKKNYFNTNIAAIKIFNEKYFENRDNLELENLIDNPSDIKNIIEENFNSIEFTQRLKYKVRVISGINELVSNFIGVDLANDQKVFKILSSLNEPDKNRRETLIKRLGDEENLCFIGAGLRKTLEVNIGDEIEVYVRTVNNAHNAVTYKIIGELYTENPEIDSFSIVVKLEDAAILADSGEAVSEIDLNFDHYNISDLTLLREKLNLLLPSGMKSYTWEDQLSDMLQFFALRRTALGIIILFLFILAITGVTNTMLMAVFERTKEIGTLSALGMKKRNIISLFLSEGAILGLFGGIIAVAITLFPVFLICRFGFTIPNADLTQNMASKIYGYIDWVYFPMSVVIAMLISSLATLYPSLKAVGLNVAQVLRGK